MCMVTGGAAGLERAGGAQRAAGAGGQERHCGGLGKRRGAKVRNVREDQANSKAGRLAEEHRRQAGGLALC